jgi:hypothetical protein
MEAYLCVLTVWRLAEDLSGLYLTRAGANQRGRGSAPQSAHQNFINTHKKGFWFHRSRTVPLSNSSQ